MRLIRQSLTCHKANVIYHLILWIFAEQTWFGFLLFYLTIPIMDLNLKMGPLKIFRQTTFI